MANKITNTQHYSDIADAIRAKNGSFDTYTPDQMAQAILDIDGGGGGTDKGLAALASGGAEGDIVAELPENSSALGIYINQAPGAAVPANLDMETLEITGTMDFGKSDWPGTGLVFGADPGAGQNLTRITLSDTITLSVSANGGTYPPFTYGVLEEFSAPNLEIIKIQWEPYYGGLFSEAISLTTVHLEAIEEIGERMFWNCRALQLIDLHNCTVIADRAFQDSGLEALVLRASQPAVLTDVNALFGTPIRYNTGFIYVPRALISSYQSAVNWDNFGWLFRALEDYTDDGTVDGEFIMPT